MVEVKTMFVTNDGAMHESYSLAIAHIENSIQEEINEILKGIGLTRHSDLVLSVSALAGTLKKAKHLHNILDRYLSGKDDYCFDEEAQ